MATSTVRDQPDPDRGLLPEPLVPTPARHTLLLAGWAGRGLGIVDRMDTDFDVAGFLSDRRGAILERAEGAVAARRLPHYEAAGAGEVAARLGALFDSVVTTARERRLDPATTHADAMAGERQRAGHDLSEVQRAINALEEQLWAAVIDEAPADAQGYALGVVSTILGAIKDRLACDYVAQAGSPAPRTLRLDELFKGIAAGPA